VHEDVAIVELHSKPLPKNGLRFDNHYCWVCYFKNDAITRVRAYLDSVMVTRLFAENRSASRQPLLKTALRLSMKACTASR